MDGKPCWILISLKEIIIKVALLREQEYGSYEVLATTSLIVSLSLQSNPLAQGFIANIFSSCLLPLIMKTHTCQWEILFFTSHMHFNTNSNIITTHNLLKLRLFFFNPLQFCWLSTGYSTFIICQLTYISSVGIQTIFLN